MTDIDISPEAVERMACILDGRGGFVKGNVVVATLRALSAALTQSRAERAAAYERAAEMIREYPHFMLMTPDQKKVCVHLAQVIRALATPDQSSALAALIAEAKAEALGGPWEDKPDALTDAVRVSHPVFTKDYKTYTEALELVSNRHGKGALVGLVNYLMAQNKTAEARGMRKAAEICSDVANDREQQIQAGKNVPAHSVDVPQQMRWSAGKLQAQQLSDAILAAIPQGDATND